jgi:hypothetical protein
MKTNKDEDRCEKTGLKRISCYHCQAPPEYEMKESTFKGSPVVEILHNGGPIHEFDKNFRFGKSKAKLFLACMDIVEELASTPYGEMPDIENQKVVDTFGGAPIFVEVESFRDMQPSSGRTIKVPWVRLRSGNNPDVHIGFGRRKAKAILRLRRQLAEWANYPLVDE